MLTIAPALRKAMFHAFVQQGVILVLTGMLLDGGFFLQFALAAFVAFWFGLAYLLLRRGGSPTKWD